MVEGKQHALAIGMSKMSVDDMYVCFRFSYSMRFDFQSRPPSNLLRFFCSELLLCSALHLFFFFSVVSFHSDGMWTKGSLLKRFICLEVCVCVSLSALLLFLILPPSLLCALSGHFHLCTPPFDCLLAESSFFFFWLCQMDYGQFSGLSEQKVRLIMIIDEHCLWDRSFFSPWIFSALTPHSWTGCSVHTQLPMVCLWQLAAWMHFCTLLRISVLFFLDCCIGLVMKARESCDIWQETIEE